MGVVIESAGDQDIESAIGRLPRGLHQIRTRDGTELRSDENGGALFFAALAVAPFGAHKRARPRPDGRERNLIFFMRLLDSRGFKIFQDDVSKIFGLAGLCLPVNEFLVFVDGQRAMRGQALDRKRPGYVPERFERLLKLLASIYFC